MDQAADSTCAWLHRLEAGEAAAAQEIWNRYSDSLLRIARQHLANLPPGAVDEEDVTQSVFGSIFRGAAEGRFANISTRDELWWLLLGLTRQKTVNHIRREMAQKRCTYDRDRNGANGKSASAARVFSLNELIGSAPTPDFVVALQEQYEWLLNKLRNTRLREIAVLRLLGYSVPEISQRIGVGVRAIERKLQLIRNQWQRELLEPDQ